MIESGRRHRRKQGMEYNEQAFKEKANLKAMKVWLALIAIMTLSYGSDLSKGIYTATQYAVCNRTADVEVKGESDTVL